MKFPAWLLPLLCISTSLEARPKTHDAALSILGQSSLTARVLISPPTNRSLRIPDGIAVDPTSGKLFISDTGNNRILRFSSVAAYQTNPVAEAVFGQPDFTSNAVNRGNPDLDTDTVPDPGQNTLNTPANLCFDASGRLWVADQGNSRVLRFDNASSKPSFLAAADAVIGQADFVSRVPAANDVADSGFSSPAGVAVDSGGRLWVSDSVIPRILRFDSAATLSGKVAASGYFGETEGETGGPVDPDTFDTDTVNASSLGGDPWGIATDASGNLWVADASNNRVLFFANPSSKANGAPADKVLGQPDFESSDSSDPPTAASFTSPYYVAVAPDGVLWVSDYQNYRILGFVNPAAKPATGATADLVLGQPNFVSNAAGPSTARSVDSPSQVAFGREGSLFLGQYLNEGSVKRWSDPVTVSTPRTLTTKRPNTTLRGRSSGAVRVQYKVTGQGGYKAARGPVRSWNVPLRKLKRKVTPVTVRAIAFDNRIASGVTRVNLKLKKRR